MATVLVIVGDVRSHKSDEMMFTEDHDVLEEFTTTASDPALGGSVLPWTAKRGPNRLRTH
jgi:hypothetical protein